MNKKFELGNHYKLTGNPKVPGCITPSSKQPFSMPSAEQKQKDITREDFLKLLAIAGITAAVGTFGFNRLRKRDEKLRDDIEAQMTKIENAKGIVVLNGAVVREDPSTFNPDNNGHGLGEEILTIDLQGDNVEGMLIVTDEIYQYDGDKNNGTWYGAPLSDLTESLLKHPEYQDRAQEYLNEVGKNPEQDVIVWINQVNVEDVLINEGG